MPFTFSTTPQMQAQQSPFATTATPQPPTLGAPSPFGGAASAFGSTPSGAFGTPAAQPQPTLFGGAQSQSSLFGATPQSQSSIFGAAPQSQSLLFGASQPSLFGASQSQSQPSMFGAPSQPSMFGAPSQPSMFGAPSQPAYAGTPAAGMYGTPMAAQDSQLPEALREIMEQQMNPGHAECKFQTVLYNVVSREDAAASQRPSSMLERTWQRAIAQNPDPARLVPVAANWFDDLQTRMELQDARLSSHGETVQLASARVSKVTRQVAVDIEPRLAALRRSHRELARKLLRVAAAVECRAAQSDASGALTSAETDRRHRLATLQRDLAAPSLSRLCDLAELAQCTALRRARAGAAGGLRDARSATVVKAALAEQLSGMQHLHAVCERARRDVEIAADGLTQMRQITG